MSLVMFSQALGGALFLSLSDTIFTNSLTTLVTDYAPSVNPQTVIDAGTTGLRAAIDTADLMGVILAYAKSDNRVFYMAAGLTAVSFVTGMFMGFKDIRNRTKVSKA